MTKTQKTKYIIGIVIALITGAMIPIILKIMPDKKIITVEKGIMIEQRALIGGGSGNVTIGKTITVTTNTN